jgi:hypothetical protein
MGLKTHVWMARKPVARRRGARTLLATPALSVVALGATAAVAMALSPAVATQPATSVGETTATLNGKVNPNGLETKIHFEYGTTTSYGSKTAEVSVGSGPTTLEKAQGISGLKANTLYHFRIVASNADGSSQGIDRTFTTEGPPEVSNWGATLYASGEEATLKAWIDPNGHSTTYQFEYGTKSGVYTNATPVESAGSETTGKYVTYTITGLEPGTWYYWRATASYSGGKVSATESSLLSSKAPGIEYLAPSEVSSEKATLRANLDTRGNPVKYFFEYGTTTAYGTKVPALPKEVKPTESPIVLVSEAVSGLKAGTLYHYRVVAESIAGTHTGADRTFLTGTSATLKVKSTGETVKFGAPVKASSSSFAFYKEGSFARTCSETEFSGEVTQNPGVVQGVSGAKMQSSGGGCAWTGFTVKYLLPSSGLALTYTSNGVSGVMRLHKFALAATVYLEATKVAECKYNLELSGTFALGAALEGVTLSGLTEPVSTPMYCPGAETATGTFTVTSSGALVKAE